ncbi:MAG: hypothetical protein JWM36_146 [Hyphomicrobiales bacterium]|nr:hypothetical protein [Hyphomicrobiales bacterium]
MKLLVMRVFADWETACGERAEFRSTKSFYDRIDGKKQRTAVVWMFDEFCAGHVEMLRFLTLCLHEHCSNANPLRRDGDAARSDRKKIGFETSQTT